MSKAKKLRGRLAQHEREVGPLYNFIKKLRADFQAADNNSHRVRYWPLKDRSRSEVFWDSEGLEWLEWFTNEFKFQTKGHNSYLVTDADIETLAKWGLSLAPGLWSKVEEILVSRGVANYSELPAPDIFAWLAYCAPARVRKAPRKPRTVQETLATQPAAGMSRPA